MPAKRIERRRESDEVARNQSRPLMNQLIERVLTVGSRFTPVNWTRLVRHSFSVERNMFAIALHRQLLEVSWEPLQVLLIGQDRYGLRPEKIVVPDRQKSQQHRQVLLEGSSAEVLVHLVETTQHRPKIVRANGDHRR